MPTNCLPRMHELKFYNSILCMIDKNMEEHYSLFLNTHLCYVMKMTHRTKKGA